MEIQNPLLMVHLTRGLVNMRPAGKVAWPERWEPGDFRIELYLFGVLPLGWQVANVNMLPAVGEIRRAEDRGHSPLIQQWHHILQVAPDGEGGALYTDRLDIRAGLLTPFISLFARGLFAYRQRRFLRLARSAFDYRVRNR